MKTYTIIGTNVEANASAKAARQAIASASTEPAILVTSQDDLAAAELTGKNLVAIWNALPGAMPVTKFTSRKVAIERIWRAIETLEPGAAAHAAPTTRKAAKARPKAGEATRGATGRKTSKKSTVLELLRRANGATLEELRSATGWQAHSVRGFLSGTVRKKMGLAPERFERDGGEKAYRLKA